MSFRLKTILGIALIEAVLLAISIASALRFLEDTNQRQLRDYSQATLENFVAMTRNRDIGSDPAHMRSSTEAFVDDRSVVYARILDPGGRVMAEAGAGAALARPFRADTDLRQVRDRVYDVGKAADIGGRAGGRVELGIGVAALQASLARAQHWGLAIAGIGMVLVILFSMALGLYLTRQLAQLRKGARRLQAGELGYQVPIRGRDELTETALVFNAMSRQLLDDHNTAIARDREQVAERINACLQLEKLVAARTAELFEAEAQASLILESSAAGLCGMDRNGRITFINPAACEMLGYDHDRVIGLDGHHLWHYQYPDGTPYPDWECPTASACVMAKRSSGRKRCSGTPRVTPSM